MVAYLAVAVVLWRRHGPSRRNDVLLVVMLAIFVAFVLAALP